MDESTHDDLEELINSGHENDKGFCKPKPFKMPVDPNYGDGDLVLGKKIMDKSAEEIKELTDMLRELTMNPQLKSTRVVVKAD